MSHGRTWSRIEMRHTLPIHSASVADGDGRMSDAWARSFAGERESAMLDISRYSPPISRTPDALGPASPRRTFGTLTQLLWSAWQPQRRAFAECSPRGRTSPADLDGIAARWLAAVIRMTSERCGGWASACFARNPRTLRGLWHRAPARFAAGVPRAIRAGRRCASGGWFIDVHARAAPSRSSSGQRQIPVAPPMRLTRFSAVPPPSAQRAPRSFCEVPVNPGPLHAPCRFLPHRSPPRSGSWTRARIRNARATSYHSSAAWRCEHDPVLPESLNSRSAVAPS